MTELTQYRIEARERSGARARRSRRRVAQRRRSRRGSGCRRCGASPPRSGSARRPSPPALAELRRRGVVVTEPRRGHAHRPGRRRSARRARRCRCPPGARDLSRGNPDPALLPDLAARARALRACPRVSTASRAALPELLELAREQLRADGIPGEALCVVSGALDGIERVLQAHLRPGDRVAVENPGYAALYRPAARAAASRSSRSRVDERGMLPARAATRRSSAARAPPCITPRGQNPTGAALDARARARAARRCSPSAPQALRDRGRPPRADRRQRAAHDARRGPRALGGHALGRQGARARPAPGGARRRRPHDRPRAGAPAVRPGLGQPHPAERSCSRCGATPTCRRTVGARERDLRAAARAAAATRSPRAGSPAHGASGLNVWIPVHEEAGAVGALLQRGWVVAPGAPYRLPGSAPAIRVTTATLSRARGRAPGGRPGRGPRRRRAQPQRIADDGRRVQPPEPPAIAPARRCAYTVLRRVFEQRRLRRSALQRRGRRSSTRATGRSRCAWPTARSSARARSTT